MNLKKIWNNFPQIMEGMWNKIFKTDKVEKIAQYRLSICKQCLYYDLTGEGCEVSGTQPCCDKRKPGGCGCDLSIKTRSLESSCPINKWKAVK